MLGDQTELKSQRQQGRVNRKPHKKKTALTLDEAIEEYISPEKNIELNKVLNDLDIVEFGLRRKKNNKFELNIHMVISPRALIIVIGGISGLLAVASWLVSHTQ